MFLRSLSLLAPPKLPKNVFFPWPNFVLHQSGTYLAPNRVCFRVPVHLTKLEIREYLRKIYKVKAIKVNTMIKLPKKAQNSGKQWYKVGAQYKKAYVTCEEKIPDAVKMMRSSKDLRKNPDLTPGFFVNSNIKPFRPEASRDADWKPRHKDAWQEPIPLLLAGPNSQPRMSKADDFALRVDKQYPFLHYSKERGIPEGTPQQDYPHVDTKLLRKSRAAGKFTGPSKVALNQLVGTSKGTSLTHSKSSSK